LQLRERPRQPDEVRRLVDKMPADYRQHFIDAIGELVSTILDMCRG
jgi:hypothetical protein